MELTTLPQTFYFEFKGSTFKRRERKEREEMR